MKLAKTQEALVKALRLLVEQLHLELQDEESHVLAGHGNELNAMMVAISAAQYEAMLLSAEFGALTWDHLGGKVEQSLLSLLRDAPIHDLDEADSKRIFLMRWIEYQRQQLVFSVSPDRHMLDGELEKLYRAVYLQLSSPSLSDEATLYLEQAEDAWEMLTGNKDGDDE